MEKHNVFYGKLWNKSTIFMGKLTVNMAKNHHFSKEKPQDFYGHSCHGCLTLGLKAEMPSALELLENIRAQMLKCLGRLGPSFGAAGEVWKKDRRMIVIMIVISDDDK